MDDLLSREEYNCILTMLTHMEPWVGSTWGAGEEWPDPADINWHFVLPAFTDLQVHPQARQILDLYHACLNGRPLHNPGDLAIQERLKAALARALAELKDFHARTQRLEADLQEEREQREALETSLAITHAQLLHREEDVREAHWEIERQVALVRFLKKREPRCSEYMRQQVLKWAGECMMCGALHNLTVDRVLPGGEYIWSNVQCLCQSCNSVKGTHTGEGWDNRRFYPDFVRKCQGAQAGENGQGTLF